MRGDPRLFIGMLLAAVGTALAAPNESTSADNSDSIQATKRELQELKNERLLPSTTGALQLPHSMDAPVLTPFSPEGPVTSRPKPPDVGIPKASSKNWLVDAMEKGPKQAGASSNAKRALVNEEDRTSAARSNQLSADRRAADLSFGTVADGAKGAAANPLNTFMGNWLSPRDAELQRAVAMANPGLDSGSDRTSVRALTPDFRDSVSATPGGSFGGPMLVNGVLGPGIERDRQQLGNPYLLEIPSTAAAQISPSNLLTPKPPSPAAVNPIRSLQREATPAPETRPFVPENLQRQNDAKYFPQLKRF